MDESGDDSVEEILAMQKTEANTQFFRFIKNNYKDWIKGEDAPSHDHLLSSSSQLTGNQKDIYPFSIHPKS